MHITMLMALICNVCQLAIMPSFGYIIVITAIFYYVFTFRSQIHVLFLHTYLANGPKHGKQNIIAIRMREVIKSIISKDYPPDWCLLIDFFFFFCLRFQVAKPAGASCPKTAMRRSHTCSQLLEEYKAAKRRRRSPGHDRSLFVTSTKWACHFFSSFFLIFFRGLMGVLKIVFLSFYDFFFILWRFANIVLCDNVNKIYKYILLNKYK